MLCAKHILIRSGEMKTKNVHDRINNVLSQTLELAKDSPAPPKLAASIDYAVFPGGARVRPRLCLAVSEACGEDYPEISDSAAAAIEFGNECEWR